MSLETLLERLGLSRAQAGYLVATGVVVLLAGGVDRLVVTSSDKHALLVTAITGAVGAGTWWTLRRWDLALAAAGAVAVWPLAHATPRQVLWVALVPALFLAIPARTINQAPRWASAVLVALVSGATGLFLVGGTVGFSLAAVIALLLAWVRPERPTKGTIGALWSTAVLFPGVLLLGLVPLNAATGWIAPATTKDALWLGIALLALGALAGLGLLGLATLIESDAPGQGPIWLSAIAALSVLVAILPSRDIQVLQVAVVQLAIPLAAGSAVASRRIGAGRRPLSVAILGLPAFLALMQHGLI